MGITLNLTQRRNKAVTACLHSLSSEQGFLTFLDHSPLYEFYETGADFSKKNECSQILAINSEVCGLTESG